MALKEFTVTKFSCIMAMCITNTWSYVCTCMLQMSFIYSSVELLVTILPHDVLGEY